ncbi:hypothetical protein ACROYT_G034242 [Oculina patagonica]
MIFFTVVFALVFLSRSEAALPNVGSCTFMEYFCDARKCGTRFYKQLQEDPKGDCNAKYNQVVNCVTKTVQICTDNQLPESQVRGIVHQSFKENPLCFEGGVEPPTMPPQSVGSPCSASFSADANACVKTLHEKYAADKSDPSLCSEQAKAKQCVKKLIDSGCTFPPEAQELLDLVFSDYNPFCENNRDPGATGKDQCDGVRDLDNPLNAAAGLKSSVLQALLFAVASLLVFVKF